MSLQTRIAQIAAQVMLLPISIVSIDKIFIEFGKDTFVITNGLSAIAGAVAGLAFTAASVYPENSSRRLSFRVTGRYFFIASVAAALGTVAKYAAEASKDWIVGTVPMEVWIIPVGLYGGGVGLLFYGGLAYCHIGIWRLLGELLSRDDV